MTSLVFQVYGRKTPLFSELFHNGSGEFDVFFMFLILLSDERFENQERREGGSWGVRDPPL